MFTTDQDEEMKGFQLIQMFHKPSLRKAFNKFSRIKLSNLAALSRRTGGMVFSTEHGTMSAGFGCVFFFLNIYPLTVQGQQASR